MKSRTDSRPLFFYPACVGKPFASLSLFVCMKGWKRVFKYNHHIHHPLSKGLIQSQCFTLDMYIFENKSYRFSSRHSISCISTYNVKNRKRLILYSNYIILSIVRNNIFVPTFHQKWGNDGTRYVATEKGRRRNSWGFHVHPIYTFQNLSRLKSWDKVL